MKYLAILAVFFTSCAYTGDATHDRRAVVANVLMKKAASVLGQFAVASLSAAASQEMSGGKVDWQHTLAQAAWQQAGSLNLSDFQDEMNKATQFQIPKTVAAATRELSDAEKAGIPSNAAMLAIANTVSATATHDTLTATQP